MSFFFAQGWRMLAAAIAMLLVVAGIAGYLLWNRARLPGPGSPTYEQYVQAFQVGVAALDADVPDRAETNLSRAIELIPQEPAAWADRGLLFLRTGRLDEAARDLAETQRLAPDNADVQKLLGLLEQRRGNFSKAAAHMREAVERDPQDVEALYRLARIIDQEQQQGSDAEYQRLMEQILTVQPVNLRVLDDRLRVAARRSDRNAVRDTIERFQKLAPGWSKPAQDALADLDRHLQAPLGSAAVTPMLIFSNLLRGESGYQRSVAEVEPRDTLAGSSVQTFVVLTPLRHSPAPVDTELAFASEEVPGVPAGRWDVALPVWLTGEGLPAVFIANSKEVRQTGVDRALASLPLTSASLVPLDWNNDFRTDLLLAGPSGLRFYQQQGDGTFTDVTAKTGLAADVLRGDYQAAWAADLDLDGDLDILLARRTGQALALRNNFDGTFTPQPVFAGVDSVRAFAWVDLDNDGAADAALLDAQGRLHVFANERSGQFVPWPVQPPGDRFLALTVMDANDDGVLDLLMLRADGMLLRLSDRDKRKSWDVAELVRWEGIAGDAQPGTRRLVAADLDNNGAIDLLASGPEGSQLWLGEGGGHFRPLAATLPQGLVAAVDLDGAGRLDLLGLTGEGRPIRLHNKGGKDYHWQAFRFRASPSAKGDNRINSFAIGGEIEVRAGICVVKQPIAAPVVHFGLGHQSRTGVIRSRWTNGTVQAEFEPPSDQTVVAVQRISGSCPFLFTWNGERFGFVTDFMWSSPLGVFVGDQGQGGFTLQTADWVKIRGDQLKPRNDFYEVRVAANLWETHFYDHLSLVAVDHPKDTELIVDERDSLTAAQLSYHLLESPRPVARAVDHHGQDVTKFASNVEGVYLDSFDRETYRGVAHDHWVEVDLGAEAPREGPVWLIARGWVYPVDSTTYFALAQGKHEQPREPVLEVPDGHGGWKVARDDIGYPAGKNKTILIRLDGIEGPGVTRRFRLRTNMEIYWGGLHYARGHDAAPRQEHPLLAQQADLHHRGILDMTRANDSSPELPNYERIVSTGQFWRDLIGFHTRYGDVRELLEKVDDRYVILCAGDEMSLRFAVPPEPKPGWKRDFIWKSDGWTKDGDLCTLFGKTVLPLPAHDLKDYKTPPVRLQDDPVYRRHPRDWEVYHTRYVTPFYHEKGLRQFRKPSTDAEGGAP